MKWLKDYHKKIEKDKRDKKAKIGQQLLEEVKKKHVKEKSEEIDMLQKRLEVLLRENASILNR